VIILDSWLEGDDKGNDDNDGFRSQGWKEETKLAKTFLMFQNVPGGSAFKPRTHIGEENITRVCILGLLSTNHF